MRSWQLEGIVLSHFNSSGEAQDNYEEVPGGFFVLFAFECELPIPHRRLVGLDHC